MEIFGSDLARLLGNCVNKRGLELHESHAMFDHAHFCLSIPPKYSVSNTIGFRDFIRIKLPTFKPDTQYLRHVLSENG